MDKHEPDKLKDWLTELIAGEEAPVDDALWAAIAPKITPPKKKRRFILWWWGCLPLLATGILGAAVWYWNIRPAASAVLPAPPAFSTENTPPAKPQKSPENEWRTPNLTPGSAPASGEMLTREKGFSAAGKTLAAPAISRPATARKVMAPPEIPLSEAAADKQSPPQENPATANTVPSSSDSVSAAFDKKIGQVLDPLTLPLLLLPVERPRQPRSAISNTTTRTAPPQKREKWQLGVAATAYSASLLMRPLRNDLYLIEAADKNAARSAGLNASFSLQKRFRPHFTWRNQISGYMERHAADFRVYYLDKPELISKVLPGNQLLVSITYADSLIAMRRNHWGMGLETGLQWHPWKALAHNVYLGGEMRWQERTAGRKWAPMLKCGLEMGLGKKQQLRLVVSGAWQPAFYNDTYFDYRMGQLGAGLRYLW